MTRSSRAEDQWSSSWKQLSGGTCGSIDLPRNDGMHRHRPPDAVIGKPSQDFLKRIVELYSLQTAKTCMIGDRLSTDIEFGRLGGLQTLLVLSGVTAKSELESTLPSEQIPQYYASSIAIINELENHKKPRTS